MRLFIFFTILLTATRVYGESYEPTQSDWQQITDLLHRTDVRTLAVIAMVTTQGLFLLCRTMLGEILGIYRLLVLAFLSLAVTIGTNLLAGKGLAESLIIDSGTLMAYQVLFHQLKRQWGKREQDREYIAVNAPHHIMPKRTIKNRLSKFFRRRRV